VRIRKSIELGDAEIARALLGDGDRHLKRAREALGIEVVLRREHLYLEGPEEAVTQGVRVFEDLIHLARRGHPITARDVERVLSAGQADDGLTEEEGPTEATAAGAAHPHPHHRRGVHPKSEDLLAGRVKPITAGQKVYCEAMRTHDVVFAIGPAGTGKTYLAVAMAVEYLVRNLVHRLILVRPAVEAGEHLGFLPGDLREKVNPYLRPLYDALHDLLNPHQVARFMERGVIEVAPLAFMRGRTLNHAFVILDEAQNTTSKQMKMFLTRLGNHAHAVVTGDVTQVDLPEGIHSGLAHARHVLGSIEGVAFVHLERCDIVRHPLVQQIVDAYEQHEADERERKKWRGAEGDTADQT